MKIKADASAEAACPRVATCLLKGFSAYSRHYVRRHFHSIRILKNGLPPPDISCPVVIYLNHASWWDPLVCLHLARKYFADRRSFAAIDEASLQRYGFFKQLGFYGIEQKSERGAMMFLRTTCRLLLSARNMVWLTPQGRFMDVLLIPLIHFVLLGFLPINRMRASRDPVFGTGCGQLFVARREAYHSSGGHSAIRQWFAFVRSLCKRPAQWRGRTYSSAHHT